MKLYVRETKRKNSDGELLVTVEVMESKPKDTKYIIFVKR